MATSSVVLVAGEASGDLHGAALVRALRARRPDLRLLGIGGPAMREAGVELLHSYEEFAVLGVSEVLSRLPFLLGVLGEMGRRFERERPGLFIPIDYPDFNIRLAARARKAGVPVMYYISPQIWAWRARRVRTLARLVDRMVVVFPFEVPIYEAAGVPVTFVGHPLLDHPRERAPRAEVRARLGVADEAPFVAFLPGSRNQEVRRILPPLAGAARLLVDAGVAVAVSRAPSVDRGEFEAALAAGGFPSLPVWDGPAADLAAAADVAVVTSGTATLETGLTGTPPVVVYRMAPLTWWIAKRLVRVDHVGLVNIAAGKRIAPELLQDDVTPERVAAVVRELLADPARRAAMRADLAALPERLGGPGAAARAADVALSILARQGGAAGAAGPTDAMAAGSARGGA
jgi:lipid-A-disaccharide synthase